MQKISRYFIVLAALFQVVQGQAIRLATLNPQKPVPLSAKRPPVVLINGYQFASLETFGKCPTAVSTQGTFGDLEASLLAAGVPVVYFFDNCAQAQGDKIENLGNILGQFLDQIKYEDGTPVPQVDIVAHSMGGLIARSYLAGLQADGTLTPRANPRVRKFVQLATLNFGSYLAANLARLFGSILDDQARAMIPGSTFLLRLATWNQGGDDLRGVDTLALAGNLGRLPFSEAGDGLVSLTSASIGFAAGLDRVRILPLCHTESTLIDCTGPGIAKASDTATIVNSFLRDTTEWQNPALSHAAAQDRYLANSGGLLLTLQNAAGQTISDIANAIIGGTALSNGATIGTTFYSEFNSGTGIIQAASASLGIVNCGAFTQPVGFVAIVRCKPGPVMAGVGPVLSSGGKVVPVNFPITINGTGFGPQRCATCSISIGATDLQVSSWSDTSITAFLPAGLSGLLGISLKTAAGSDSINIMAADAPEKLASVTNGASFVTGFAPGGWVTIKGDKLARTTRIWTAADIVNGNLPTSLDGVSVKINGKAAYMYYVSPGQLNVLAPSGDSDTLASANLTVEVTAPDGVVQGTALRQRYAPAIFTVAGGYAAALKVDGAIPDQSHPARPGDVLAMYVTGMGTSTAPPVDASRIISVPATLNDPVIVTVGGSNAPVAFAGLTAPGLYQINFTVPQVAAGNQPVAIKIAGVDGQNTALIAVAQ